MSVTAPDDAFLDVNDAHLRVFGNVHADGLKLGQLEVVTTTSTGSTIQFLHQHTAFTTTSNIEVGTTNHDLFVDTNTSRVGILTNTPTTALDVNGTVKATAFDGDGALLTGIPSSAINGTLSQWTTVSGPKIHYSDGNVGIGIADPLHTLDVVGDINVTTDLSVGGTLSINTITAAATHALSAVTAVGASTGDTIQLTNATTGLVTTANVEVGGELAVTGNVAVDTDTLFVDSVNNRVGVGTTSPQYRLDVGDGGGDVMLRVMHQNASSGKLIFGRSGTTDVRSHAIESYNSSGSQNNYMKFLVHDGTGTAPYETRTEVMTLRGDGNVGIGTTSPSHPLTVQETTTNTNTVTYPLAIRAISSGTVGNGFGAGIRFQCERTDTDNYQSLAGSVEVYGAGNLPSTSDLWNMRFGVRNNDTAVTPMTLKYNGNVGIGTTSPNGNLHIMSDLANASSQINPSAQLVLHSSLAGLDDDGDIGASLVFTQRWSDASPNSHGTMGSIHGFKDLSAGNYGGGLLFKTQPGSDTAPVERMRIDRDGNVGIGTTSPGQLLTLGGQVNPILRLQTTKGGDAWGTSSSDQYGKLQWYGYDYEMNQGNGAEMAGITIGTTSQFPGAMQMRFFVGAPTFSGGNWNLSYVGYLGTSSVSDIDFTGQHRNFIDGIPATEYTDFEGLIVSANKNKYYDVDKNVTTGVNAIQISQSLPLVSLSTKEKDKACFGVISGSEDPDTREYSQGSYVSVCEKQNGDRRAFINSVGEGAIWVTNINGSLESGDYITTSNVAGYGQKQDSDSLKNYTVAKITMDCNFEPVTQPVQNIKKEMGDVNYWVKTTYENVTEEEYSNLADENRQIVDGIYQKITKEESKTEQEGYELEVRQELVNVLDEHGQIQWEDDPSGATEKAYKIRYLDADGNITDEANHDYKAAFVGCTYHCG